ncbi:MAG: hypothetical protein OEY14_05030 [Myxococcales bacterium]|nr:hypothetical protein [Myxococcales bacterium]
MNPFAGIEAQDAAVETLRRAVESDRVASAYLFEGPSGVGKERTALALAQAVLGPAAAERVVAGKHPDVRIFRPREDGHRNIQVEFIRQEILPYAQFAPFEAQSAFLIFPEADVSFPEAHPEGANAILKTLEEPRPGVGFILLAERPERLLPTIRSRCQSLRFARLPARTVDGILERLGIPETDREAAVALCQGRADRALELAEDGRAAALFELAMRVDGAVAGSRPGDLVEAAEALAKSEDLPLALDALSAFYRDVARASFDTSAEGFLFRGAADRILARAQHIDPGAAASRVETIQSVLHHLERNANPQMAMDGLLHQLRRAD